MRENEWTASIKALLKQCNIGKDIYFDTLKKVPYAQEILSYDKEFEESSESMMNFETDLLIYERSGGRGSPIRDKLARRHYHAAYYPLQGRFI